MEFYKDREEVVKYLCPGKSKETADKVGFDLRFAPCFYLECEIIVPLQKDVEHHGLDTIVDSIRNLEEKLQHICNDTISSTQSNILHPGTRKYKIGRSHLFLKITASFSCNAADANEIIEHILSDIGPRIKNCVCNALDKCILQGTRIPVLATSIVMQIGCFDSKENATQMLRSFVT